MFNQPDKKICTLCLLVLICLLVVKFETNAFASFFMENFIDREDGALDTSNFLAQQYGSLTVPIIITEPAIGYGGGLGIASNLTWNVQGVFCRLQRNISHWSLSTARFQSITAKALWEVEIDLRVTR